MIEIRDALEAQARTVRSAPDVGDVRRRVRIRRRRRTVARGVGVLVAVVVGAGSFVALRHGDGGASNAGTLAQTTPGVPATVALKFDDNESGARANSEVTHGLERHDSGAEQGPWTVIVRRPDGSLGHGGAVVTFPAASAVLENVVDVNGAAGGYATGTVVWPTGAGFARVRGDLDDATLLAVARATTVVNGRPVVGSLRGLDLVIVRSAPYRSPSVREMRYGSAELGEGGVLGNGLTYASVFTGGGFEDLLFAQAGRTFVDVGGRRTVVSNVGGGNATMAWELAPGVVGLVGYSGASSSAATTDALARLVLRTRPMDERNWETFGAAVDEQVNDFGG